MLLPELKHGSEKPEYDTWQEAHRREHSRLYQITAGFPLTPRSISTIGASPLVAPVYGATITIDVSKGTDFNIVVTDGNALTVSNPSNIVSGQHIFITLKNTSGGAMGAVTFDTLYRLAAWTSPATGFSRSISFRYDGTSLIELNRTTADVPN